MARSRRSTAVNALMVACLDGLGDAFVYTESAREAVRSRFQALVRGPEVEEATRELLLFAFFLAHRKNAASAAADLVLIAESAAPALRARGKDVADIFASQASKQRLRALGLAQPPHAEETSVERFSVLELLAKRR